MGIITECLMVLLLCQTICTLADPMEQKDEPTGPQDLEEFEALLGLETNEELAAQAFAEEIQKRGGSCKEPKIKKNRTVKQLNSDYVDWHNYYRCLHGVGPVRYDTTLEASARRNVNMNVAGGGMVHTSNSRYGENLWAMWGGGFGIAAISGQSPVKSWYDEMKRPGYSFNRNRPTMFSYGTGHFTQVVWASTKKIGCWTAEHPYKGMTRVFVACNYDPPGNMNIRPKSKNVDNWNKNVPPPI